MRRILSVAMIGLTLFGTTLAAQGEATLLTPASEPVATVPAKKAKVAVIKLSDTLLERPKSFEFSLSSLTGTDKSQRCRT